MGAINARYLAALAKANGRGEFVPLRELLLADDFTFIEDDGHVAERILLEYAEAWSFVHFLLQGQGGRNVCVFDTYFTLIQQGEDPVEAFVKAFSAPLDSIEKAWRNYVKELLRKPSSSATGSSPAQKAPPPGGRASGR